MRTLVRLASPLRSILFQLVVLGRGLAALDGDGGRVGVPAPMIFSRDGWMLLVMLFVVVVGRALEMERLN